MNRTSYPKPEMDLKLEALSHRICKNHKEMKDELAQHREVHKKILDQVVFTNGKVRKIIMALIGLGAFTAGLGVKQSEWLIKLFI